MLRSQGLWNLDERRQIENTGVPAAAAAKLLQLCTTLCDPIDSSPPGYPIPGILQARTLEWVAISFSNAWKWKVKVKSLSRVPLLATQLLATRLLVTPWTVAYQAPPSMGFSRQEYWSGVPLPSPGVPEGITKMKSHHRYKVESIPEYPCRVPKVETGSCVDTEFRGRGWNWCPKTLGRQTIWVGRLTMEIVTDFIFLGSKITADGDFSH